MAWFRLIRFKNLLIVFLTQLLVWYCLIYDNNFSNTAGQISKFLLLSFSTVLIAAAGYIINDYFDIKIDIINRPGKVVLERTIPLKAAIIAHVILNGIGLALAGIVAYSAHHLEWVSLQVACIVLLWFYSTDFKRQFVTGNVVIALLTALTIITFVVYRPAFSYSSVNDGMAPISVMYIYALFAFALTWIREIVKDMEDFKGDAEGGCVTMPIKMGLKFSTVFTQILGGITLTGLIGISCYLLLAPYSLLGIYAIAFTCVPLALWCIFINKAHTSEHYHKASRWLKIIMLTGLGSLIPYHFTSKAAVSYFTSTSVQPVFLSFQTTIFNP